MVRIASWVFVAATAAIVAVTGLWADTQQAIFVLLAVVSVFILLVHDLLPSAALGVAKFVVEGSVAITFATLLVMFTGRDQSPFFFVFPLIVGGAALVVSQRVTIGLAIVASLGYLVAIFAGSSQPITTGTIATIAINLTALVLLAYVAMGIATEQRRARDAAIRLSTVDPLTGLFNRTYFFAAIDREIARSARSGRGFCLLMMDLDELKSVNDRHGHFVGDRVLAGWARSSATASGGSIPPPATAAMSSWSCCQRPKPAAPTCWPRRSGSVPPTWPCPASTCGPRCRSAS